MIASTEIGGGIPPPDASTALQKHKNVTNKAPLSIAGWLSMSRKSVQKERLNPGISKESRGFKGRPAQETWRSFGGLLWLWYADWWCEWLFSLA